MKKILPMNALQKGRVRRAIARGSGHMRCLRCLADPSGIPIG